MPGKKHTKEQIIDKLRKAEEMKAKGATVAEIVRELEVSEQTYYRWRNRFGGVDKEEIRRLRKLEKENKQVKKLVADLSLDKQILEEALEGKYSARPGSVGPLSMSKMSLTYPRDGRVAC